MSGPARLSPPNVNPLLAAEVAVTFLAMRSHHDDPTVRLAYMQLERRSDELFAHLTQNGSRRCGIDVAFTRCRNPYASDREMISAVRDRGVLEVTTSAAERDRRHPLLDCGFGRSYDRFRAVHDIVGHVAPRLGFDRDGEFAAWLTQERFYDGLARWALATELHAEHSVLWTTGVLSDHKAVLLDRELLARVQHSANDRTHRA